MVAQQASTHDTYVTPTKQASKKQRVARKPVASDLHISPEIPDRSHHRLCCPAFGPEAPPRSYDRRTLIAEPDSVDITKMKMPTSYCIYNKPLDEDIGIPSLSEFDEVLDIAPTRDEHDEKFRYIISPFEGVHATRTEVTHFQQSSVGVKERYATVLYHLYDERKTRIVETQPDGAYIQRSESLPGVIIRLGTSYRPLTQESLAFFKQNAQYLRPGPSNMALPGRSSGGPLLILAPPETTFRNIREGDVDGIDRILGASRPSAEVLPITCVTLSKASPEQSYHPLYLFYLVLDLIRLCSHHCAASPATTHLIITDLELNETDIVCHALRQVLSRQRSFGELSIEILMSHRCPSSRRIRRKLQPLADIYNNVVAEREPSSLCPGFSLVVKRGNQIRSLTIASLKHDISDSATHRPGIKLTVFDRAIESLLEFERKHADE